MCVGCVYGSGLNYFRGFHFLCLLSCWIDCTSSWIASVFSCYFTNRFHVVFDVCCESNWMKTNSYIVHQFSNDLLIMVCELMTSFESRFVYKSRKSHPLNFGHEEFFFGGESKSDIGNNKLVNTGILIGLRVPLYANSILDVVFDVSYY